MLSPTVLEQLPEADADLCDIVAIVPKRLPSEKESALSARDAEIDRVIGLEIGADDYIVKPFGPRELVARINVALRRAAGGLAVAAPSNAGPTDESFTMGDLRIDPTALRAFRGQQSIDLSRREAAILRILFERSGKPVSRNDLLELA